MATGKNAFYAQSGGVTAVINATASGLIQAARNNPDKIANVYAVVGTGASAALQGLAAAQVVGV